MYSYERAWVSSGPGVFGSHTSDGIYGLTSTLLAECATCSTFVAQQVDEASQYDGNPTFPRSSLAYNTPLFAPQPNENCWEMESWFDLASLGGPQYQASVWSNTNLKAYGVPTFNTGAACWF